MLCRFNKKKGDMDKSGNPTIEQRYVLAVLFFGTEGEFNKDVVVSNLTPENNKVGHWTNYGTLGLISPNSWN